MTVDQKLKEFENIAGDGPADNAEYALRQCLAMLRLCMQQRDAWYREWTCEIGAEVSTGTLESENRQLLKAGGEG